MLNPLDRRRMWSRIIGVERRSAPLQVLEGHPLPNPSLLEDEEFLAAKVEIEQEKSRALKEFASWNDSARLN